MFFNNLCVGKTLFGCDLQVVGKSEDIVILLVYFFSSSIAEMAACIRYEDQLHGMSNYLQWKVRMTGVLKENRLWTIVSTLVTPPASDPIALEIHEVKEAKAQRLILDGIRDHLIPCIVKRRLLMKCGIHRKACMRLKMRTG